MARWTVSIGDDQIVIETTADGHVLIEIPAGRRVRADRRSIEELRLKLGAAIADTSEAFGE